MFFFCKTDASVAEQQPAAKIAGILQWSRTVHSRALGSRRAAG